MGYRFCNKINLLFSTLSFEVVYQKFHSDYIRSFRP